MELSFPARKQREEPEDVSTKFARLRSVLNLSNRMLYALLCCVFLSPPLRAHWAQRLLSQSTPSLPARPLTRLPGRLQQVARPDRPLNLWLIRQNLAAHMVRQVRRSHRMVLSQLLHLPRQRLQINQMDPRLPVEQQVPRLLPFDHRGSPTLISPSVSALTRRAPW